MQALMECVPNISEGRDASIIKTIAEEISNVKGVKLLHIDSGHAVNRTVFTIIGLPNALVEAAFLMTKKASELIDMQKQQGTHPRIGVVDVCPFIPLQNCSMLDAIACSKTLAQKIAEQLLIPCYLYEQAQPIAYRKNLEDIRKGGYEKMEEKMNRAEWKPDFGNACMNKKSGAMIIGARELLVAYNINLDTTDLDIAKQIAIRVRSSGGIIKGQKQFGLLKNCKAIAWYVKEFDGIQISTNLTNYKTTSMFEAHYAVQQLSKEYDVKITGSELIGMITLDVIKKSVKQIALFYDIKFKDMGDKECIQLFESYFGLNDYYAIEIDKKVLDNYFPKNKYAHDN